MTDKERRYEELLKDYDDIQEQLKVLNKRKVELKAKLEALHSTMTPFIPNMGYYATTTNGLKAVYISYSDHTMYTKPLYNSVGKLQGRSTTLEMVNNAYERWQHMGFKIVG